jgi:DNA-binding transcriptional ArsR family regulator
LFSVSTHSLLGISLFDSIQYKQLSLVELIIMIAVDRSQFNSINNRKVDALIIKSLGHPIRLKILTMLDKQECNVKNIWECLGVEQCIVSQHLAVLKHRGIIVGKRNGAEVIYTIINPLAQKIVTALT